MSKIIIILIIGIICFSVGYFVSPAREEIIYKELETCDLECIIENEGGVAKLKLIW